jgi:hypothetical protein
MNAKLGDQERIMVQMNGGWTQAALHTAARMARNNGAAIILVDMIPAGFPGWLGTDMGNTFRQRHPELADWKATLEDYGVDYQVEVFQYIGLVEGLVQAAEYFDARNVFANVPHSIIPYWQQIQRLCLLRRLNQNQCQLYDADTQLPPVAVEKVPVSILR